MTQANALYQLQQLDLQIGQHHKRQAEIDHALQDNQTIVALQTQIDTLQTRLAPLRTRSRDLDLELQTQRDKINHNETRLYSGSIRSPKELEELQLDIENLKRHADTLENQQLELMLSIEDLTGQITQAEHELAEATVAFNLQNVDLLREKDTIQAQIDALQVKRQQAAHNITPDNLRVYTQLRPKKANKPVALLQSGTCSGCGVEQTLAIEKSVRRAEQLVFCSNCGRILTESIRGA